MKTSDYEKASRLMSCKKRLISGPNLSALKERLDGRKGVVEVAAVRASKGVEPVAHVPGRAEIPAARYVIIDIGGGQSRFDVSQYPELKEWLSEFLGREASTAEEKANAITESMEAI